MILHALNSYYERLKDDDEAHIPLPGFGKQHIHFALILDRDGCLVKVRDLREKPKNKPVPISLTVPVLRKKKIGRYCPQFHVG